MPADFENAVAYEDDDRLVIRSTCRKCGAYRFVSVRDGSLDKWESEHRCPDAPKSPPKSGQMVQ